MTVKTADTILDVLRWVESNGHHKGEWIGPNRAESHLVLSGHGCQLRIPAGVHVWTKDLIEPGGQFDARMYRANAKGREYLETHEPPLSSDLAYGAWKLRMREESARATERARSVLKPGDVLYCSMCAGLHRRVTFSHFGTKDDGTPGAWIITAGGTDNVHATHIHRVNGVSTTFMDIPGVMEDEGE